MAFPSPQEIINKIQGGSTSPLFSDPGKTAIPSPQDVLKQAQAQTPGPSFGSTLVTKAKELGGKVLKATGSFFKQQGENVRDTFTDDLNATPSDYLEGIKKTGNGIVSIAKGFNEGVVRILESGTKKVIGEGAADRIGSFGFNQGTPNEVSLGAFGRSISGKEDVSTYQEIYGRAKDYALENKASIDQADAFAGLTVLGALFVDNPLFGPGKKQVFKLSEEAISRLAKEESEDAIKTIIREQNPALTDMELDAMAPAFRNTNNPDDVRTLSNQIRGISNAPLSKGSDVPSPDQVLATSRQNMEVPTQAKIPTGAIEEPSPSYFRAMENSDQTVKFVPVEGQVVKISDELETFVHQPENGAYEVLEASTGRKIGQAAETAEEAIASARKALEGKDPAEIKETISRFVKETGVVPREAQRNGGLPTAEGAIPPGNAPRPFDQSLIRDVSRETETGPILERMARAFPRLSEQALAPIAKRLTQLKRTGDIEGILQVVRNIDEDIARSRAAGKKGDAVSKEAFSKSIAKVGSREAVGDLPPAIGELLTPQERGRYLDNISRVVRTPDEAVLAQQEYDALWEHADQRIIDRYEELRIWRDIVREQVDAHPAKGLQKYYGSKPITDRTLAQVLEDAKGTDKKAANLDDIVTELGYEDLSAADEGLADYVRMREQLKEIEDDLREIRPKARAARVLQSMVEDVPVISRKQAGDIESLANPDDVRNIYKDISGFSGQAKDVYRNFEKVFGSRFKDVKRVILDPFDASKGKMVDEIKALGDRIEENVIDKLKIKRGSKESAAVQLYGEGAITQEDLVKMVGSDRVPAVMEAVSWFRAEYDRLLDEVNEVRAQIFPNDPSKLIPKRKEYFRHFQELSDGFKQLIDIFESPAGIDPQLAGLSEWTKPKSKFLPFAQTRLGTDSTIDAVGGFLNYAPAFSYAKHIDPHIGNFRYLRRRLAEVSPTPGTREVRPTEEVLGKPNAQGEQEVVGRGTKLEKQEGINNFLTFLDDYANDLAGKTNPMDRYIQKVVPGGRVTMRVVDWINNRVKANTILGNASSSIAQVANIPNGLASAKLYAVPGIQRALSSIFIKDDAMQASTFLKERYAQDLTDRFKIDWVNHPVRASTDRAKEFAVWMITAGDEMGTRFIWQSHYAKALAERTPDPIKYADDITRKLVAGRGVGEVPLLQKSKLFKLVAPFQLEVGNAWYVLGDFVKRKDFGAIATLLLANYLFNEAAENVRGSRVVFDPINSLIEGTTSAADEMKDHDNADRAAFKFVGRQVGEILSNIPLGQTVAQALPDDFVKDKLGFEGGKKELFGEGDPGRFGGGLLAIKGAMDPLYKLVTPFGGAQIKKTIEGIQAMLSGKVEDKGGKLSFEFEPTLENIIQAVLFGKNGTSQAREFFDTRSDLFTRIYQQDAERTETKFEAEKIWAEVKELPREEQIKRLSELDENDPTMGDAVFEIAEAEALGLTGTDRLVKMLGVDNGERAKYIAEQVADLKTREEQVQYLQDLDTKELISDTVFEQLTLLLPDVIKAE